LSGLIEFNDYDREMFFFPEPFNVTKTLENLKQRKLKAQIQKVGYLMIKGKIRILGNSKGNIEKL
jgi:hypothetical protein